MITCLSNTHHHKNLIDVFGLSSVFFERPITANMNILSGGVKFVRIVCYFYIVVNEGSSKALLFISKNIYLIAVEKFTHFSNNENNF